MANAQAARAQSSHSVSVTNGATNQVYEIMKISRDSANWSQSGYEITVRNTYYNGGGIVRAFVGYGYQDPGTLTILEAAGQNQPKIFLGTEAIVSGTIKYLPVNIQLPAYQAFSIEVKFGTTETTSISGASQVQFTGNLATTGATGANHDGSVSFSGNVGIGTTSPPDKLSVFGGIGVGYNTSMTTASSGYINLRLGRLASSPTNITDTLVAVNDTGGPGSAAGDLILMSRSDVSAGIRMFTGSTSPVERVTILGSGNVGIGTTSPARRFEMAGSGSGEPVLRLNRGANTDNGLLMLSTAGSEDWLLGSRGVGDNNFRLYSYGTSTDVLTILRSSGNVGIGTTSPQRTLDLGTSGQLTFGNNGYSSTSSPGLFWYADNTNYGIYKTAGSWSGPNYQQLMLNFPTGVVIDGGSAYGKSGTVLQPNGGNVGIGTPSPQFKLDVNGNTNVTGNITATGSIAAKYQDVAEWVPSSEQLSAGTVVVLDSTKANQVTKSSVSYDTRVAGVVSEQPGIALGEKSEGKVLVATTGRVRVKVDATKGPIHIGDLLVTSDVSGMAMKSKPMMIGGRRIHAPGTLIGKALEPWEKGKGSILVLLSLQ
jgi:hypothetical protein